MARLNKKNVGKILKERMGLTKAGIAQLFGVHRSTVTEFFNRYPELLADLEESQDAVNDLALSKKVELIKAGDRQMIMFQLETKGGHTKKQEIEHATRNDEPIKINVNLSNTDQ